jgi:hypothetical protein
MNEWKLCGFYQRIICEKIMWIKTLGFKLESNNHVIFVDFFPLIFENDGSLATNDEEIIIVLFKT